MTSPRYLPARVHSDRLDLEEFARRCGLHPGLVRRFVALGLIPAVRDRDGRLWFDPSQVAAVARLLRLRATLPLNYAALGLVADLLDRITVLETALRIRGRAEPVRPPAPVRHSARLTTTGTTAGTTTGGTTTPGPPRAGPGPPTSRRSGLRHGPEPPDPDVPAGPVRSPGHRDPGGPHRGRRRAPAARPARTARRARTAAADRDGRRPRRPARRPRVRAREEAAHHPPGGPARPGLGHPAAGQGDRGRRARGQAAEGRVRLRRAPAPRARRGGPGRRGGPAARPLRRHRGTRSCRS